MNLMRRKIKYIFRLRNIIVYPISFIKIIVKIKNWPTFLINYFGIKNFSSLYEFRNGLLIKTAQGIDTATILATLINNEYGAPIEKSTVIDIGANIGTYSIDCAKKLQKCKIYTFEPEENNYKILLENISLNNLDSKIISEKTAIYDKKGKDKLYISTYSPFHSMKSKSLKKFQIVKKEPLGYIFKKYKIKKCDLLKLDCEGSEYEIIKHAKVANLGKIQEIRMEYHDINKVDNINNLIKYLSVIGFKTIFKKRNSDKSGIIWLKKDKI
jgi:FkbM family methyltransferase